TTPASPRTSSRCFCASRCRATSPSARRRSCCARPRGRAIRCARCRAPSRGGIAMRIPHFDLAAAAAELAPELLARWSDLVARTSGVIAVHLYGQPCDLDAMLALCQRRGWWLVEDAAQAHGATWRGRRVGTFGQLAGWSFYPSKNLGCFGDGGAVTGADTAAL